ncbi:MAG: hypothetical protein GX639_08415 [Fibrobacter sp.]|nr:hypothetical protein [Fibrobacter sp.]
MKRSFALFTVVLMILFSNYQIYAQVLCQESKCFGCCPSDSSGFSSCRCDVDNGTTDHQQSVSVIAVSKVLVRFYYSSVVLHSPLLDLINSEAVEFQKYKTDDSTTLLTISSFQIPLRI